MPLGQNSALHTSSSFGFVTNFFRSFHELFNTFYCLHGTGNFVYLQLKWISCFYELFYVIFLENCRAMGLAHAMPCQLINF